MTASPEVAGFFAAYEAVSNELDVDTPETFFADACMAASPGFAACTAGRTASRAALTHIVAYYRGIERGPAAV